MKKIIYDDFELKEKSRFINFLVDSQIKELERFSIVLTDKETLVHNLMAFIGANNLIEILFKKKVYYDITMIHFLFKPKYRILQKLEKLGSISCLCEFGVVNSNLLFLAMPWIPTKKYELLSVATNTKLNSLYGNRFKFPDRLKIDLWLQAKTKNKEIG